MHTLRRHSVRIAVVATLTLLAAASGVRAGATVISYYSSGGDVQADAYDSVNNTEAIVTASTSATAPGRVNATPTVSADVYNWNTPSEATGVDWSAGKTTVKVSPDLQQGIVRDTVPVNVGAWNTNATSITVSLNEAANPADEWVNSSFNAQHSIRSYNIVSSGYGTASGDVSGTLSAATDDGSIVVNNAPVDWGEMDYGKNTYHEVDLPQTH